MGLFSWLTGNRSRGIRVAATLPGPGDFAVDVVGESKYQDVIEWAAGGRTRDGCEKVVDAVLVLEDANPYDPKAVQVLIGGRLCGYLSRENARTYRKQLKKTGRPNSTASCKAVIVGGWDRGRDDRGHFGIRLDLPHND